MVVKIVWCCIGFVVEWVEVLCLVVWCIVECVEKGELIEYVEVDWCFYFDLFGFVGN